MHHHPISIVIPVYNSQECLKELCRQIFDALNSRVFEIIFVNDASTDGSWEILKSLALEFHQVKAVNLRKNSGQDAALLAGLKFAQHHYVVIMDDDLQHSPYDIDTLLQYCHQKDLDVCYAKFPKLHQAWWKNWGGALNGLFCSLHLNKKRGIYLSPFKVIRGSLVQEINLAERVFPYLEMVLLNLTDNYDQIPITHYKRYKGQSNYSLRKSTALFLRMIFSFSIWPLRIALILGFVVIFLSLFAFFLDWKLSAFELLLMAGCQLIATGMNGEYVGRIYYKTNNFRSYSIREIVQKESDCKQTIGTFPIIAHNSPDRKNIM